ncbi:hypothetical protein DTO021C3_7618 [Paecilomyces variotii]|nr:hypothetical protein DTO021C3_7618 [Paecilomyces variotii]
MALPGAELFNTPQGFDCSAGLIEQASLVTFKTWLDDSYINCRGRIVLDSQNLRIILDIGDQGPDKPSAQIIFSLENCRVNMGIETQGDPCCYGQVQTACTRRPRLFDSFDKTELWVVEMRGPPLRTGKSWELEEKFRQPWDEIYEAAMENGTQMVICKAYNPRHELRREIQSW